MKRVSTLGGIYMYYFSLFIRRCFLLFISCCLCLACDWEKQDENAIHFLLVNDSSVNVEFMLPVNYDGRMHYTWGNMKDIEPSDTTRKSAKRVGFHRCAVFASEHKIRENSGFHSIPEMAPYDTVRIFVYDYSVYLQSPPPSMSDYWEKEDYYCRYDLTTHDLYSLVNSDGDIVICFPPDESMRNVKMWPPYEISHSFDPTTTE